MSSGRSNSVSWGLVGPSVLMLSTSLAKGRPLVTKAASFTIPMTGIGLFITIGSFWKSVIAALNDLTTFYLVTGPSLSGMTLITSEFVDARRKMISAGNLVYRLSFLGNGISVGDSKTELFPADWSSQTTSWGNERAFSRSHLRSWATTSKTRLGSSVWRPSMEEVVFSPLAI